LGNLRSTPADGAFAQSSQTGTFYRFAGGAPIPFNSWSTFGGLHPAPLVDITNFTQADGPYPWNHVRQYPDDGTLINAVGSPDVFRVVGGKLYRACDAFDASKIVQVAPEAIANAGGTGIWGHLGPIAG
jgi:hypothetical protein